MSWNNELDTSQKTGTVVSTCIFQPSLEVFGVQKIAVAFHLWLWW